jgi:dihydroflavonol-4-reductase
MRVLVTGANGLLGCNLVRELAGAGHRVRALVRKTSNAAGLAGLPIETATGDVRDAQAVRAAADGCEVIFHLAGVFSYWGYDRDEMLTTARDGAVNVIDAAADAKARRIVFTLSSSVLGGTPDPTPMDESSQLAPGSGVDYFESKVLQERTARERAKERGVEVVYTVPSIMLGPHDHRPSEGLIAVINYLRDAMKVTYPGGGNYLHAADSARGHLLLADKGTPGERYILCGENAEWTAGHKMISELAGVKGPGRRMGRTALTIAAAFMELGAVFTRKHPLGTRVLARQIGNYFWYRGDKAAALGFTARPAREVCAATVAWLLEAPHLTEKEKRKMRPLPEVLEARRSFAPAA